MKPKTIASLAGLGFAALTIILLSLISYKRMNANLVDYLGEQGYHAYTTEISMGLFAIDPDQGFQPHYRILVTFIEPGLDGLDYHLLQWSITGGDVQLNDPKVKELQIAERKALKNVESTQAAVVQLENEISAKLELTLDPTEKEALKTRLQPKLTSAMNARASAIDELEQTQQLLHTHIPELVE